MAKKMTIMNVVFDTVRKQLKRTQRLFNKQNSKKNIKTLIGDLISVKGESAALAISQQIIGHIDGMTQDQFEEVFTILLEFDIDTDALSNASKNYKANPSKYNFNKIKEASKPNWETAFERINECPGGTSCLVNLRSNLIALEKNNNNYGRLDASLKNMLTAWFNKGFLVLEEISWSTSAEILEKIIEYEAVHEISSWVELKHRLEPEDRECFAYFHPAMPNEPLIFVEVALMNQVPEKIESILSQGRVRVTKEQSDTAVFYSISNCQVGLSGISFGNFLIKRVASELQTKLPNLKNFVTLSPVPNFRIWLDKHHPDFAETLSNIDVHERQSLLETLNTYSALYFVNSDRDDGLPNDAVARFHLGNGAQLISINQFGDGSQKAWESGAGMMVNYEYILSKVEERHEDYHRENIHSISKEIRHLAKAIN